MTKQTDKPKPLRQRRRRGSGEERYGPHQRADLTEPCGHLVFGETFTKERGANGAEIHCTRCAQRQSRAAFGFSAREDERQAPLGRDTSIGHTGKYFGARIIVLA